MENKKNLGRNLLLLLLLLIILILGILIGRRWCTKTPTPDGRSIEPKKHTQVLFWKVPDADMTDFKKLIDDYQAADPTIVTHFCANCEDSLVMVEGANIDQGLGPVGQLASGGSGGKVKPSGGGSVAYWSINFEIKVNDAMMPSKDTNNYNYYHESSNNIQSEIKPGDINLLSPPVSYSETKPVVVAIFDTGIDWAQLAKQQQIYNASFTSCLGGLANSGWNFSDNNSTTEDDYFLPNGHGANVSDLIYGQVQAIAKTPIKILPVKFIKANGEAHLYDVLCGLAYAKKSGAKIINASFGYYSCKDANKDAVDSAALLFKEFIRYYLTQNNILLIAAAGNMDDKQQLDRCGKITRNLDSMYFYPASFAADPSLSNVIAVTTVGPKGSGMVSPHQNFSDAVVDVGVVTDIILQDSLFLFRNPRVSTIGIEGSSYATPIVTATIAGYYEDIKRSTTASTFHKDDILRMLTSTPFNVFMEDVTLKGKIKGRLLMKHSQ